VRVGILESTAEEPHSKLFRYLITTAVFAVLVTLGIWYLTRFHHEKATVKKFLDGLVAGQTEQSYSIWKASPTYSYKDFLDDWGADGYYGPVKSYRITDAQGAKGDTSVVIIAEISPFHPFPEENDSVKQSKTKEVRIWVERRDQSLSFPP
jgi:hypothetical protein